MGLIKKMEDMKISCFSIAAYLSKANSYTELLVQEIKSNELTIDQLRTKYNQKLSTLMA